MSVQIWITIKDLDDLVKASSRTDLDFTPEIQYTQQVINDEQICVQLDPDLFVYLTDRDILVK